MKRTAAPCARSPRKGKGVFPLRSRGLLISTLVSWDLSSPLHPCLRSRWLLLPARERYCI